MDAQHPMTAPDQPEVPLPDSGERRSFELPRQDYYGGASAEGEPPWPPAPSSPVAESGPAHPAIEGRPVLIGSRLTATIDLDVPEGGSGPLSADVSFVVSAVYGETVGATDGQEYDLIAEQCRWTDPVAESGFVIPSDVANGVLPVAESGRPDAAAVSRLIAAGDELGRRLARSWEGVHETSEEQAVEDWQRCKAEILAQPAPSPESGRPDEANEMAYNAGWIDAAMAYAHKFGFYCQDNTCDEGAFILLPSGEWRHPVYPSGEYDHAPKHPIIAAPSPVEGEGRRPDVRDLPEWKALTEAVAALRGKTNSFGAPSLAMAVMRSAFDLVAAADREEPDQRLVRP